MKKILSYSLFSIVVLQSFVMLIILGFALHINYIFQTSSLLKKNNTTEFVFSKVEFSKIKIGKHEFRFNNTMWDIKKIEQDGDKLYISAIDDNIENGLLSLLEKNVTSDSKKQPLKKLIVKLLTQELATNQLLPTFQNDGISLNFLPYKFPPIFDIDTTYYQPPEIA